MNKKVEKIRPTFLNFPVLNSTAIDYFTSKMSLINRLEKKVKNKR